MKILSFPHPALTTPTTPWDFNQEDSRLKLLFLSQDLSVALGEAPTGVALAANQVGLPHRLFVIDQRFADVNDIHSLVINPRITSESLMVERISEGCLSFPGMSLQILRPPFVEVLYQDIDGKNFEKKVEGTLAQVFMHECEHLDGKTFLNHLPRIQRFQIMSNLRKRKGA